MMQCKDCGHEGLIGVEYDYGHPDRYDGVSEWRCRACNTRWGRWTGKRLQSGHTEPRFGRPLDLDAIRERAQRALDDDAGGIVACARDVPALIAEVERRGQRVDDAESAMDATMVLLGCLLDWHDRGDGEEPQNLERYRTDLELARGWMAQAADIEETEAARG